MSLDDPKKFDSLAGGIAIADIVRTLPDPSECGVGRIESSKYRGRVIASYAKRIPKKRVLVQFDQRQERRKGGIPISAVLTPTMSETVKDTIHTYGGVLPVERYALLAYLSPFERYEIEKQWGGELTYEAFEQRFRQVRDMGSVFHFPFNGTLRRRRKVYHYDGDVEEFHAYTEVALEEIQSNSSHNHLIVFETTADLIPFRSHTYDVGLVPILIGTEKLGRTSTH